MSHYFKNDQSVKSEPKKHQFMIENVHFEFITDHGVFSKKGIDFGTKLLIETIIDEPFYSALDLGCGYGPIGITLKRFHPESKVDMVDVNERALELAKINAKMYSLDVDIYQSDGLNRVQSSYDLIVTNPPIRAGKEVIYRFFKDAKDHLNPHGKLFIVIQKKQGAPSTIAFCKTIYHSVEVVQKKSGYQIIKCGL